MVPLLALSSQAPLISGLLRPSGKDYLLPDLGPQLSLVGPEKVLIDSNKKVSIDTPFRPLIDATNELSIDVPSRERYTLV
uniref:Uncharacterized protein n=1 Tax=Brassica campestris TaxID=3711 RepID=M4F364_BRACM